MGAAEIVFALALASSALGALAYARVARPSRLEHALDPPVLAAAAGGDASLVLQRLCGHSAGVLGADEAAVLVRDRALPGQLVTVAAAGSALEAIGSRSRTGTPDCATAPVTVSGAVVGALSVGAASGPLRLGPAQVELLGQLAGLVGLALEHRHEAGDVHAAAAESLSAALARADEETRTHSDHVARLARLVGRRLKLSEAELFELELGARLHDVGKVRVPPEILRKPGPLTDFERALMRPHTIWGSEMVAAVPGLEAVALVVRFHHERFDGSGYPDGLAGERIPLASRIVAVCDAYGAMTAERPYRSAMEPTEALRELECCAGTQFDPRIANLVASGSLSDDLDHEPLRTASVEFGVEDLLPRA